MVAGWSAARPSVPLRTLLLGVTPDIARSPWPEGSSLLGVDGSFPMVRGLWPRDMNGNRWAACGDWADLPVRDGACDIVIGDGSLNCVRFPDGLRSIAASVARVLCADGWFIARCFARPDRRETPGQVFAAIGARAYPSFHHFKFRLLMAMQPNAREGVCVGDVYEYWKSRRLDESSAVALTGWEIPHIRTMDLYKDSGTIHTFPTIDEMRSVLSEFFEEIDIATPSYALGERCPTLVLRQRARP
jgi:SAM-dependent methyltransferase